MNCAQCSMKSDGRTKNSLVLSAIREIQNLGSSIQNFFLIGKANCRAGREIFVEFVFLLCENGLVPGSVTRPTGRIQ